MWWSARVPTPLPAGYQPAARAVVLALHVGAAFTVIRQDGALERPPFIYSFHDM